MVWNNYRNDDYANYLYVSEDYGASWSDLAEGLPEERVLRTMREDPRNPDVLYLGAEIGLYFSMDRGNRWTEIEAGMPTLPFNDLVVHPRDNDLVLGTHGRGVWIIDQMNAFQELAPQVLAAPVHVFSMEPAYQIRRRNEGAHTGDVYFRGQNPPVGALIDYWLREAADSGAVTIDIQNSRAEHVATLEGGTQAGLNRVVWDLRHQTGMSGGGGFFGGAGEPWVVPGSYTVTVTGGENQSESSVEVFEDPRIQATPSVRTAWTETLLELAGLRTRATEELELVREGLAELEEGETSARATDLRELERELNELSTRIRRLMGDVSGVVATLTGDQSTRMDYYAEMVELLAREAAGVR